MTSNIFLAEVGSFGDFRIDKGQKYTHLDGKEYRVTTINEVTIKNGKTTIIFRGVPYDKEK